MLRYVNLYWLFLIQRIKVLLEYRANFLIGAASTVVMQVAGLLAIWVVMARVPTLVGWRFEEVLLIYGLITLAKSINHMFADNLWTLGRHYVQTGGFDRFLVRPIDPLFHLLADRFCHDGIGNFLVGAALTAYALQALAVPITVGTALYLVLAVLSGGAIFIALNLITCVSAFWVMDSVPVTRILFELHEFAKYPVTMYGQFVGILLTWCVPFAFASFYPASYLLGREVGWLAWAPPFAAAILMLLGYQVWRFGLRHYQSTGS